MVPYLYHVIKKIMNLIVKPDIMIKCINGANLKNVNLSNKDNFMKSKDMNLSFSVTAAIVDLRKRDPVLKKFLICYHYLALMLYFMLIQATKLLYFGFDLVLM